MTSPGPAASPRTRCAVHPVRPAVDACPVCDRPRCAADAAGPGPGCPACSPLATGPATRPPGALERSVRAALAGYGAALLGALVAAQYVGAELFSYVTPLVVGVVVAAAAQSASRGARTGPDARRVRLVAGVLAVLGVALGFAIEQSQDVLGTDALLPYAAAVAGVVLWTLPPRGPRRT